MNNLLQPGKRLGIVIGGSTQGIDVRLEPDVSVEDLKVGSHATVQGERARFYGLITDVSLASTDPHMAGSLPDISNPLIAQVLSGTTAYAVARFLPMLTLPNFPGDSQGPRPAKTIPAYFSPVYAASEADIALVFGQEDGRHFYIGNPLDLQAKVCLDLPELLKRSNGVFGKSGTGKTFLTRLLLVGTLQSDLASSLVFDMHSEYGWHGTSEGPERYVKGLKQLFPAKVAVFSLDEESSRRRGLTPDHVVRIGFDDIDPEDVQLLRETLNLTEVAASAAFSLERRFGRGKWLTEFLALEGTDAVYETAKSLDGVNEQALRALHNRLQGLRRFPFLVPHSPDDSVKRILDYLDRGMHVVLEFGRYGSDLSAYILVANLLTRRIHAHYVARKESAMGEKAHEPRPLVIVIEEAHKFLNPQLASHTIFGTIARELRKYNVTLLVIDQRPSAIDSEVMSQIGTRITCLLDNEHDVDAVLSGVSGSRDLKGVLARLESKQQALIFGHALPVPVVIQVRDYGSEESYKSLSRPPSSHARRGVHDTKKSPEDELFG